MQGVQVNGPRVRLGPFSGPYWKWGLGWYNDPEIIAMTSDDPHPLDEQKFREVLQADLDHPQSLVFGVADERLKPIGIGMLRNIDATHRNCDLHLTIGEKGCWNRGYGTEAVALMRDLAFGDLDLHRVVSTPFAHNRPMLRCLEKCGFDREGLLREALWIENRFVDVVVMATIKKNREAGSGKG